MKKAPYKFPLLIKYLDNGEEFQVFEFIELDQCRPFKVLETSYYLRLPKGTNLNFTLPSPEK